MASIQGIDKSAHLSNGARCQVFGLRLLFLLRSSDTGNGNHSVLLPMIFEKNKDDQMLPSSNISLLLVSV